MQVIAKLRQELSEAHKEAATARVLLKDLYDGFRPAEQLRPEDEDHDNSHHHARPRRT